MDPFSFLASNLRPTPLPWLQSSQSTLCKPAATRLTMATDHVAPISHRPGDPKVGKPSPRPAGRNLLDWILPGTLRPRRGHRPTSRVATVPARETAGHQTGLPPFRDAFG